MKPSHPPKASISLTQRPRRLRLNSGIRSLVREHQLQVTDLIQPLFVKDGKELPTPIASMPGCFRYNLTDLLVEIKTLAELGVPAVALFPALENDLKNPLATESLNDEGLLQRVIRAIKKEVPNMLVITDVAMDPYSSDGHDGYVENGQIINDVTLEVLANMAVAQAKAGADIVAPSDMMDGRVGYIRQKLDEAGYEQVSILAYSAKYCSAFYGPFRDALDSAPRGGDKKTYQMDPANIREALREVELDIAEGADMVMVKPGLPYLDVVRALRETFDTPIAAYHVSGEYAMVKAAAEKGWIDERAVVLESLLSFKRAGADMILTYYAKAVAQWLAE
jgi:porphobilinogen synthase